MSWERPPWLLFEVGKISHIESQDDLRHEMSSSTQCLKQNKWRQMPKEKEMEKKIGFLPEQVTLICTHLTGRILRFSKWSDQANLILLLRLQRKAAQGSIQDMVSDVFRYVKNSSSRYGKSCSSLLLNTKLKFSLNSFIANGLIFLTNHYRKRAKCLVNFRCRQILTH